MSGPYHNDMNALDSTPEFCCPTCVRLRRAILIAYRGYGGVPIAMMGQYRARTWDHDHTALLRAAVDAIDQHMGNGISEDAANRLDATLAIIYSVYYPDEVDITPRRRRV